MRWSGSAEQGWTLAICTNKPQALAAQLLEKLGIAGRFAAMLGADSLDVRKPDPRHLLETVARAGGTAARAVLVGDTTTDREAARGAGMPCVLVGFGPEGAGVARLEPEAVLDHYAALPDLLDRLVPRDGWRVERAAGIEPASLAWKARVLPLHNARATA